MKKIPNTKTTEELLQDLNDAKEIPEEYKVIDEDDSVLTFIRYYNIQPGKIPVKKVYLYKLYKKFTKEPLVRRAFSIQMNQYFDTSSYNTNAYWLINQKALNLSEKALQVLKKETTKQNVTKMPSKHDHFESWIKHDNITKGTDSNWIWVSAIMLYNIYDKWAYFHKKKTLSRDNFNKMLRLYFPDLKQTYRGLYFKLNNSICKHITPDMESGKLARNSLTNEKEEQKK
jgi:predicted NUDIX family phosphoesterase